MPIPPKSDPCDVCGELESTHTTPFYCDQTPAHERILAWEAKADKILEETE
jgi:hypothetical protein